ncbi:MAG: hypothetical protein IAE97_12290 [Chthoniobacterales bacterium]|nr:hypothetical protein [Chthoniobacterales bacterium]
MKTLRTIHLYLGCLFAPMIVFMAVSGIWQVIGEMWPGAGAGWQRLLSTLHTGHALKSGETLSSPVMQGFLVAAAASLAATMVLGIVMAFRFGHRRTALLCLSAGIVVPAILIVAARG